jgi:hypothetical protein
MQAVRLKVNAAIRLHFKLTIICIERVTAHRKRWKGDTSFLLNRWDASQWKYLNIGRVWSEVSKMRTNQYQLGVMRV